MPRPASLQEVEVVTFDCYGTLIDWEGGAKTTLRELLPTGFAVDEDAFFQHWEQAQWQLIHGPYRCYRDIVAESFSNVAQRHRLPLAADEARAFANAIPSWKPFPDTPRALAHLKKHLRLGIISNIDDDLLAGSVAQIGLEFDLKVTAQQARSYKPDSRPFELALEQLELEPGRIAHAAFGFEYDLATASRLGFRTALVRRARKEFPSKPVPDLAVADLDELAAVFV